MKFNTGIGILDLPREHCVMCIATDHYMTCTACEFKQTLVAYAKPILDKMNEELNRGK